jgi:hypothetical protein
MGAGIADHIWTREEIAAPVDYDEAMTGDSAVEG